jgi:transcriptional regulator with XRE-family HTH domain
LTILPGIRMDARLFLLKERPQPPTVDLASMLLEIIVSYIGLKPMGEPNLHERIAARVREFRAERSMSLDALAGRSGVSRSTISLIERAETSPTAVVLEKLAAALNIALAALFEPSSPAPEPVARSSDQVSWRDPGSGYVRRNVSPAGYPSPIQIVEITFPAGAHVAYETDVRQTPLHQQVWVLEGRIDVTVGDREYALGAGDCLAFAIDRPIAYRNRTRKPARYAVVIVAGSGLTGRTS